MLWWQNIPFICIMLTMLSAIVLSVIKGKAAKILCLSSVSFSCIGSGILLFFLGGKSESFTFMMGHFPAPWGNEIRAGALEALLALAVSVVMLMSLIGGMKHIYLDIEQDKLNLYFVMNELVFGALLALIYTNDIFTGYVFVEITTIAACGILMIRQIGRTTLAAVRYMTQSLLGSGLFLIGVTLMFDLTGHLLMPNMKLAFAEIIGCGTYEFPMLIIISLVSIGLAIKCGLFPFHFWMPDTYGYATPASGAVLSGLVSKGYIIFLIKIFYRVIGYENIANSYILDVLFVFGLAAIIVGSISAIRENDIRRMIAFSSAAQIGYIFVGLSLGTSSGVAAAIFQILSHAVTKPLLFITASELCDVSGGSKKFHDLTASAHRNKIAGIGFLLGSLSMVGFPMFSGFITKILLGIASLDSPLRSFPTLLVLAISVVLNAVYYLRTVLRIYMPQSEYDSSNVPEGYIAEPMRRSYPVAVVSFIMLNLVLGMSSHYIVAIIERGLSVFG